MFCDLIPADRYGIIYLITQRESGKQYVGQTIDSADKRWKEHVRGPVKGVSLISNAAAKHGREAFSLEVLDWAATKDELDHKEGFWIAFLDSQAPNGYNLKDGGSRGKRHPDSIAKQSATMMGREAPNKGVPHTEEHKIHISVGLRKYYEAGHPGPNLGRKASDETRAKLSEAGKGRPLPLDHPWRQPGRSSWNKGRKSTETERAAKSQEVKAMWAKRGGIPTKGRLLAPKHSKPVQCIETGVVYATQQDAVRKLNPHWSCQQIKNAVGRISSATRSGRVAFGFHWKRIVSNV